jgi:hypothetical protein
MGEPGRPSLRWDFLGPSSVWSAIALELVASLLMALNRFGGLAVTEPRSVLRLVLVGVWGWLGLAVGIWAVAGLLARAAQAPGRPSASASLQLTLAMVGWAYVPIAALGVVILIAAGLMQLLGPGLVVGALVVGVALPAALVTGTQHVFRLRLLGAAAAVAVPYAIWLLVVARHVFIQVRHLL